MDTFIQGEDIRRTVTLEADGATPDTSIYTEIEVRVYNKRTLSQLSSFSFTGGTIEKETPTSDGIISFIVDKTDTQDVNTGIYSYELETSETDADYSGSVRHRKFIGDCFKLIENNE